MARRVLAKRREIMIILAYNITLQLIREIVIVMLMLEMSSQKCLHRCRMMR